MTRTVMLAGIGFGLTILGTPGTVSLGVAYSFTFKAFGGVGPFKFAETGSLPSGLTFTDNGNGTATLAGTTSAPGNYPIAVTLSDSARTTVTASYTLAVQALPLSLSGHIAGGPAGVAASGSYTASGGIAPYTFAVTSGTFPTTGGLSTAGAAQGNWSTAGNYSWQVTVTDSASVTTTLSDSCTNVVSLLLTGSYSSIYDNGDAGSTAGYLTISGGSGTYSNPRVTAGSLPTGLTPAISGSTLVLNGTTSAYGSFTATVAVDSSDGQTATKSVTIIVGDPYWSSTKLLCHFDGANGATTTTDQVGHAITNNGGQTTISTANYKFGGSSSVFAAAGDWLLAASTDFDFPGQFTIDCWVSFNVVSSVVETIIGNYSNSTTGFSLQYRDDLGLGQRIDFGWGDPVIAVAAFTPTSGTWYHLEISRDSSNVVRIFINGSQIGSNTTSSTNFSGGGGLVIGGLTSTSLIQTFSGYIDDIRITKTARHTANFTAPTRAAQNGGV